LAVAVVLRTAARMPAMIHPALLVKRPTRILQQHRRYPLM
jgi:hypothetical protein